MVKVSTARTQYRVKTIVATSGERLPLLVNSQGQPNWDATVFTLTQIRSRNRSTSTLDQTLRSIIVLMLFLDKHQIDIHDRLKNGRVLDLYEIETLSRCCRLPLAVQTGSTSTYEVSGAIRLVPLEKFRSKLPQSDVSEVHSAVIAGRLRTIRAFLIWLANERLASVAADDNFRERLTHSLAITNAAIDARVPAIRDGYSSDSREGLSAAELELLLKTTHRSDPGNPWRDAHTQIRNELLVRWLIYLGLRRGELLGVRISDLNFRAGTVLVARRADDINDPRPYQPNAKTRAREIPLSAELQDLTFQYVVNTRSKMAGARKHDFLFVATDTGKPLSIPAFSKIFLELRNRVNGLPKSLVGHLMRYTCNDLYSAEMERQKVPEEIEKKTRSYLMGWSETSASAAKYCRRYVRARAKAASLDVQSGIVRTRGHGNESFE